MTIKRASYFYAIPKNVFIKYVYRLSNKYYRQPEHSHRFRDCLIGMFDHGAIGFAYGIPVYREWEWAFAVAKKCRDTAYCRLDQKRHCRMCEKYIPVANQHQGYGDRTCGSEWCERLYSFYTYKGYEFSRKARKFPPALKFDFYLTDYIRRHANESI